MSLIGKWAQCQYSDTFIFLNEQYIISFLWFKMTRIEKYLFLKNNHKSYKIGFQWRWKVAWVCCSTSCGQETAAFDTRFDLLRNVPILFIHISSAPTKYTNTLKVNQIKKKKLCICNAFVIVATYLQLLRPRTLCSYAAGSLGHGDGDILYVGLVCAPKRGF